jgi:hypothetical protein
MNWPIPVAGILIPGNAVPPIAVETAVSEAGKLGQNIQTTLPDHVPGEELFEE